MKNPGTKVTYLLETANLNGCRLSRQRLSGKGRSIFAECRFESLQGSDSHAKTSAQVRQEAASENFQKKLLTPLDEENRRGYLSPLARE